MFHTLTMMKNNKAISIIVRFFAPLFIYVYTLFVQFIVFFVLTTLSSLHAIFNQEYFSALYSRFFSASRNVISYEYNYSGFYTQTEYLVFPLLYSHYNFFKPLLSYAKKALYFFLFIVSYSFFLGLELSNESLLLGCIIFTIFLLYSSVKDLLISSLSSDITNTKLLLQRKLELLSKIYEMEKSMVEEQSVIISSIEECIAKLSVFEQDSLDVDSVIFDNLLNQIFSDSLFDYYTLEIRDEFYREFFFIEDNFEEACSKFIEENFLLSFLIYHDYYEMLEIYNFFVYFIVSLFITLLLTFAAGQLNLVYSFDYEKFSAYECGFDPFEHTRFSFDVRFYLVAIFYIIFDLEVIFFFPLSLNVSYMGLSDFVLTNFFIFFLFAGIIYEFWYGKLDWSLFFDNRLVSSLNL